VNIIGEPLIDVKDEAVVFLEKNISLMDKDIIYKQL